jgi:hypothetical protein
MVNMSVRLIGSAARGSESENGIVIVTPNWEILKAFERL